MSLSRHGYYFLFGQQRSFVLHFITYSINTTSFCVCDTQATLLYALLLYSYDMTYLLYKTAEHSFILAADLNKKRLVRTTNRQTGVRLLMSYMYFDGLISKCLG
jgi:hypothetical protein